MTDPTPTPDQNAPPHEPAWQQILGLVLEYIQLVAIGLGLLIGGAIVKSIFGPKADRCDSAAGQFVQQESTGEAASCGLNTFLTTAGTVAQWLGILAVIALVVLASLQLFASANVRRESKS